MQSVNSKNIRELVVSKVKQVRWDCWTTSLEKLLEFGWNLEVRYNPYSNTIKVMLRDSVTNMYCRAVMLPYDIENWTDKDELLMDVMNVEHNKRINKAPKDFIYEDRDDILDIYDSVIRMQKDNYNLSKISNIIKTTQDNIIFLNDYLNGSRVQNKDGRQRA